MVARQEKMDTYFFVDVAGDGAGRDCRACDQAYGAARASLGEIGASLGRPAFQHEISRVSFRARCGVNSIFWRLNFCSPARRSRLSPNPDSDRILADVHRRTLSIRCRVRSGAGIFLRGDHSAILLPAIRKSVRRVNPNLTPIDVKTQNEQVKRILAADSV